MGLIVGNVDVDVATFEWVDTSTYLDRVLILIDPNGNVAFIWSILIASWIVKIEPGGLATLASHNTDSAHVSTRNLAQPVFLWRRAQVFVSAVQLDFLKRHEEVDYVQ